MAEQLSRETLFVALTRPQMFAGVTYGFFVTNCVLAAELFLVLKSFWVLAIAAIIHVTGATLSLWEPRIFDLWITRVGRCPRVKNYGFWGCNSYRP